MPDEADKKINKKIENSAEEQIGDIEIAEYKELKTVAKEDLAEFKSESEKLRKMMKCYQVEKKYGEELDKIMGELKSLSEEMDVADIQEERDFLVERLRVWNERLEKIHRQIEDADDEIKSILTGKWLKMAERELTEARKAEEKEKQERAKAPAKKKEAPAMEKLSKPKQKEAPAELYFDSAAGILKLPGGTEIDVARAKGHCLVDYKSRADNILTSLIIEGRRGHKIRISAKSGGVVKIEEKKGWNSWTKFLKSVNAKVFIENFIREQAGLSEAKPAPVAEPAPKVEKKAPEKKKIEKVEVKKPKAPDVEKATPAAVQPPKIKEVEQKKPAVEVDEKDEVDKKVEAPALTPEAPEEKIEIPTNFGLKEIAGFFKEKEDDSVYSNYDSISRGLEQARKGELDDEKMREVLETALKAFAQRAQVALALKNSRDKERAKKWKREDVLIAAYQEFLKKQLDSLPPEESSRQPETLPEELEIPVELMEPEELEVEKLLPPEKQQTALETEVSLELNERDKKITELKSQLEECRKNLVLALANRERAGNAWGTVKNWLGSIKGEVAEIEYETAWEEYEEKQKELLEQTQTQADVLKDILENESQILQKKVAEHYKGKENVVAKIWKRLGEMNLYNYLQKKKIEVAAKNKAGEIAGVWDKFWANRAVELTRSGTWAKIGARALSARLGISLGLLGIGLYEVPGLAASQVYIGARTAFVGTGSVFGGRAAGDALQNLSQRWLGKRGEVFNSREEAEEVWQERLGLTEEATGGDLNLPSGKDDEVKTGKRYMKLEKAMDKVEATINILMDLKPEERLREIQSRIAAIEAYAYVNGFDLEKDDNYHRLTRFRDRTVKEVIKVNAEFAGDARRAIKPDNLVDALAYLESRRQELDILGGKIKSEKRWRWGKRVISVVVGAVAGSLAYLSMIHKAAAIETGQHAPSKLPGGGGNLGETPKAVDELVDKYHFPAEGLSPSAQEQVKALLNSWEKRGLSVGAINKIAQDGLTDGEIADVNRLLGGVAGHREAAAAISRTLESGKDSSGVLKSMLVQPVRGSSSIEGLLQKQLKLAPEQYGYDLKSGVSIQKWAGHQASVLAQEQDLSDKYFVFSKNKDQFVILRPDGKIELVGKTYVMEEVSTEPLEVVSEHRIGVKDLDKMLDAQRAGDSDVADKMLEESAKHLTDQEEVWLDKKTGGGTKALSPEDYETLRQTEARGHIYEDIKTGEQYHSDELDFVGEPSKQAAPGIQKAASPAVGAGEVAGQELADKAASVPAVETQLTLGPDQPALNFSKGDLDVNVRFEYGVGGKVVGYEGDFKGFSDARAYDNFYRTDYAGEAADYKPLIRAKNLQLAKDGEIHQFFKNRGFGNSSEAKFLKNQIHKNMEIISHNKNMAPHELFKPDKLVEFGFEESK